MRDEVVALPRDVVRGDVGLGDVAVLGDEVVHEQRALRGRVERAAVLFHVALALVERALELRAVVDGRRRVAVVVGLGERREGPRRVARGELLRERPLPRRREAGLRAVVDDERGPVAVGPVEEERVAGAEEGQADHDGPVEVVGDARERVACVGNNHWFGTSRPNFEMLSLGQFEVDSADFWTDRSLSASSRSAVEEAGPNRSSTRARKSG